MFIFRSCDGVHQPFPKPPAAGTAATRLGVTRRCSSDRGKKLMVFPTEYCSIVCRSCTGDMLRLDDRITAATPDKIHAGEATLWLELRYLGLDIFWSCVPAACAAACEVPLRGVKQVGQSLLALTMSSPGANKSTQRPKLVPAAPSDMS